MQTVINRLGRGFDFEGAVGKTPAVNISVAAELYGVGFIKVLSRFANGQEIYGQGREIKFDAFAL